MPRHAMQSKMANAPIAAASATRYETPEETAPSTKACVAAPHSTANTILGTTRGAINVQQGPKQRSPRPTGTGQPSSLSIESSSERPSRSASTVPRSRDGQERHVATSTRLPAKMSRESTWDSSPGSSTSATIATAWAPTRAATMAVWEMRGRIRENTLRAAHRNRAAAPPEQSPQTETATSPPLRTASRRHRAGAWRRLRPRDARRWIVEDTRRPRPQARQLRLSATTSGQYRLHKTSSPTKGSSRTSTARSPPREGPNPIRWHLLASRFCRYSTFSLGIHYSTTVVSRIVISFWGHRQPWILRTI